MQVFRGSIFINKVFYGFFVVLCGVQLASNCLYPESWHHSNYRQFFVTNIFLVIGFQFLRSHLWFNNQLTFYIVGFSNYVPSTFDVPMFKDCESNVVVVEKKTKKNK